MTQIIAIANQKGGVGKSTSAVTLGHGLAQNYGHRTLLVDLDSQGNVSDSLGVESGDDLYRLLFPGSVHPLHEVITPSGRQNLDIIRSDKTTAALKVALSSVEFREFVLAEKLEQVDYGLVLLDCAPSVDLMHTAALIAADLLIVPTRLDQLSLKGIRDVLESLTFLQKKKLTSCQLAGIIPTFYDRVTKESYQQLRHLAATFKQKVLPPIPLDTQCREATRFGKTLWEYAPNTRALMGFANGNGRSIGGYIQVMDRIQEML